MLLKYCVSGVCLANRLFTYNTLSVKYSTIITKWMQVV